MKYKGYTGHVEYDDDAKIFHGEVLGIKDVISLTIALRVLLTKGLERVKKSIDNSIKINQTVLDDVNAFVDYYAKFAPQDSN